MNHNSDNIGLAKSIHILSRLLMLNPSKICTSSSKMVSSHACTKHTYKKENKKTAMHIHFLPFLNIPHSTPSFVIMRITRLPHLTRKTRRRHDRFFFFFFILLHKARGRYVPHRALLRNAAAFNLQLARLALFLRRQRFSGPDRGAARFVAVDVGLQRGERSALLC